MNDMLYFNNGSCLDDEVQQLKNEPVIRYFAAVNPDTFEIIRKTNPTLHLFISLAKKIMTEAEG